MKKIIILCLGLFGGLVAMLCINTAKNNTTLYQTIISDFERKHPEFDLIDFSVGDGDLSVAYVHIKYKNHSDKRIHEVVWQYWSTQEGWKHREKLLNGE